MTRFFASLLRENLPAGPRATALALVEFQFLLEKRNRPAGNGPVVIMASNSAPVQDVCNCPTLAKTARMGHPLTPKAWATRLERVV
jgi:hypothetical protein